MEKLHSEAKENMNGDLSNPFSRDNNKSDTLEKKAHLIAEEKEYLPNNSISGNKQNTFPSYPVCIIDENLPPKRSRKASKKKMESLQVFLCANCPKTFTRLIHLKSHSKVHEENKTENLECDKCNISFESNRAMHLHKRSHSSTCSICHVNCSTVTKLKNHMKIHQDVISGDKEKPFVCKECGSAFSQSGHLSIHTRTHTGEKPYTCEICNTNFKQISHLKTHVRTHTKDKPYQCNQCPAAFTQNSSLKRHKRAHTGEKPYKCDLCGMTFVVKSNMQRHLNTHTGAKPFRCDLCSSSFGQAIDLKRHKISHTGIKPYRCAICEAAFSRKNNLKWHVLTHSDIAGYECSICFVGFSSPSDLKAHMRNHAPPKPFTCDICPSSFRLLDSLTRHKMIHTGERPLKNKSGVREVLNIVTKIKPYICIICGASFCEKRNLKRHTLSVHPELVAPILSKRKNDQTFSPVNGSTTLSSTMVTLQDSKVELEQTFNDSSGSSGSDQYIIQEQVQSQDGFNQAPQFMLAVPGQTPKPARPAGLCQNHSSHILTMMDGGSFNQWQSWCFCNPQNIPSQTGQVIVPSTVSELNNDGMTRLVVAAPIHPTIADNTGQLIMAISPAAPSGQQLIFNPASQQDSLAVNTQNVDLQSNTAPVPNQYIEVKVEAPSFI